MKDLILFDILSTSNVHSGQNNVQTRDFHWTINVQSKNFILALSSLNKGIDGFPHSLLFCSMEKIVNILSNYYYQIGHLLIIQYYLAKFSILEKGRCSFSPFPKQYHTF